MLPGRRLPRLRLIVPCVPALFCLTASAAHAISSRSLFTPTGAAANDGLSRSVASAGDVNGDGYGDVIVGAYGSDVAGTESGRAYIYYGGPSADAVADLTLTGEASGDYFGLALAPAGDVNGDGYSDVIVGAFWNNAGGSDAGRAYVYYGGPSADAVADLTFTGAAAGDELGTSVGLAGDVNRDGYDDVIVGASGSDAGGSNAGQGYVYYGGPSADAVADLTLTGAAAGDNFGGAVASAGDVNGDGYGDLIVGAANNGAGGASAGRAYVFYGGPSADAVADLALTGAAAGDNFGGAVASAGDVNGDGYGDLIVGSQYNDAGGTDAGRAYVTSVYPYEVLAPNGGETWATGGAAIVRWRGHDVADIALSYDGGSSWTTLAVGVGSEEENEYTLAVPSITTDFARIRLTYSGQSAARSNSDASAAVFRIVNPLPASAAATRLAIAPTGLQDADAFGTSVANAGDVNGDGFGDVVVGATGGDALVLAAGAAYVFYGGATDDATIDLALGGRTGLDNFGQAVSSAGDMNRDGFGDLVVGAPLNDAVGSNAGRAYVFTGGAAPDTAADLTLSGAAAEDRFGVAVAGVGDVNADGFDDVLVGAHQNDAAGADAGRAYLYYGGFTLNAAADLLLNGAAAGDLFGMHVAPAGDVNEDGIPDFMVGAPLNDAAAADAGAVYVYFGGDPPDSLADLVLLGSAAGERFGQSVAAVGDVNGDGAPDLAVGAPSNDAGGANAGRVYVFFGGSALDGEADAVFTGPAAGDSLGTTLAGAGDVNRDGFADLIAGAPLSDLRGGNSGTAYVFFGGLLPDAVPDMVFVGEAGSDIFGSGVASAGDFGGDGFPDLLVGARLNDTGGSNRGRAYLYDAQRYHLTAPAAGATWNVGAAKSVAWSGAEPADVWLSVDGGRSFDLLASGAGGEAANALALRVPHSPTRYARVRVTPSDAAVLGAAVSDSLFTIQSSVTLLELRLDPAPPGTGGVVLSWRSDPGPEDLAGYRLEVSGDGGAGAGSGGDWRTLVALTRETSFHHAESVPGARYRLLAVNGFGEELLLGEAAAVAPALVAAWPLPYRGGELTVAFATAGAAGGGAGPAAVAIYDVGGRLVRALERGEFPAGSRRTAWDGRNAAGHPVTAGVYFLRVTTLGQNASLRFAVVR